MSNPKFREISRDFRKTIERNYRDLTRIENTYKSELHLPAEQSLKGFEEQILETLAEHLAEQLKTEDGLGADFIPRQTDLLILMIGTSIEPLMLSIAIHRPRFLALIYTEKTSDDYIRLKDFFGQQSAKWKSSDTSSRDYDTFSISHLKLKDTSNPQEIYEAIQHTWRNNSDTSWSSLLKDLPDAQVALDVTGGKKTMLAGAWEFASVTPFSSTRTAGPFPVYYMDFDEYDTYLRRPKLEECRYRRVSNAIDVDELRYQRRQEVSRTIANENPGSDPGQIFQSDGARLGSDDQRQLVELLLATRCISPGKISFFLDQLPPEIGNSVPLLTNADLKMWIVTIVQTVTNATDVSLLKTLLETVKFYEDATSISWQKIETWAARPPINIKV